MNKYFDYTIKALWLAGAVSMFIFPASVGAIIALGLASSIIVFNSWLNTQGVNEEIIHGLEQYRAALDQRCSLTEEAVEGVAVATRHNTSNIATHTEELKRLQTTMNYKELN